MMSIFSFQSFFQVCYEVQACTQSEIDEAFATSHSAQRKWAKTPLWERAALIHRAATVLRQYAELIATRKFLLYYQFLRTCNKGSY